MKFATSGALGCAPTKRWDQPIRCCQVPHSSHFQSHCPLFWSHLDQKGWKAPFLSQPWSEEKAAGSDPSEEKKGGRLIYGQSSSDNTKQSNRRTNKQGEQTKLTNKQTKLNIYGQSSSDNTKQTTKQSGLIFRLVFLFHQYPLLPRHSWERFPYALISNLFNF